MPRRNATGVVCIFLIWGIDDVYIVLFSVKPLTVTCAGLSLSLVLIVVFLVVRDRSKRKVPRFLEPRSQHRRSPMTGIDTTAPDTGVRQRVVVRGIEISPFGPGEGRRSRLSRITTRRDPRAFFRLSTTRPLVGRNVHTLSGSDRISTTTTARTPYTLDCGLDARRPRFDPPARSDVLPGGGRRVVGADADPCRRPRPEVPARRPPRAPSARPPPLSGVGVTLRIPPPRPRAAHRYGLG